ncbi:bifunctional metallophosphatase/5'-nucleotidase [Membranihabitans marinus]|uniref:bifunctional metallophosphatase/5'-nucleotidase n=1 Tax=Membranihabitans marinus TaxID=1227546 RepID=UPI001F3F6130|nr:metallophosphatase [Membranihabitans marinus]
MLRRKFIKWSSLASLSLTMNPFAHDILARKTDWIKLTILHTNDVHSRIDPFPDDGSRNANAGGAAKRAALIQQIRSKEKNVLLLDSGDIFQGTPYFNLFKGELEIKLMSAMEYDVATIGNHDFDLGLEGFDKQLPHANFDFVSSNYDFSDTMLNNKILPYVIKRKGGIKIGIFGLGIQLEGLVPQQLYGNTIYTDPITVANQTAKRLKHDEDCDVVICLSHLGFKYDNSKIDDLKLAEHTENIDLILGGHTHTFLVEPILVKNRKEEDVIINQAGWAGILLGRIDLFLEKSKSKKCYDCKNLKVL